MCTPITVSGCNVDVKSSICVMNVMAICRQADIEGEREEGGIEKERKGLESAKEIVNERESVIKCEYEWDRGQKSQH